MYRCQTHSLWSVATFRWAFLKRKRIFSPQPHDAVLSHVKKNNTPEVRKRSAVSVSLQYATFSFFFWFVRVGALTERYGGRDAGAAMLLEGSSAA